MRFPLAQPPFDPKVQEAFDKVNLGPLAPQNFLRVLAHHPRILGNVVALGGSLMYKSGLSERLRELVIFRVAARTRSNYEWAMHRALFADKCSIDEAQLEALKATRVDPSLFTREERLAIAAADELHDTSTISQATWNAMAGTWAPQQLLEIIVLVGHYHLVAFFMNATGAPPEEGAMHLAAFGEQA